MSYDWSKVPALAKPIQTTMNDVILSGHGALPLAPAFTNVPPGVEFIVIPPVGSSMSDVLGQALENCTLISYLGLKNTGSNVLIPVQPNIYTAGSTVPDYVLSFPNGLKLDPNGPHLLGVTANTTLSNLWLRVTPFIQPGKTIRVYWAACTAITGAKNPVIVYK